MEINVINLVDVISLLTSICIYKTLLCLAHAECIIKKPLPVMLL